MWRVAKDFRTHARWTTKMAVTYSRWTCSSNYPSLSLNLYYREKSKHGRSNGVYCAQEQLVWRRKSVLGIRVYRTHLNACREESLNVLVSIERRGLLGLVTDCTSSYGTRNLEAFYYTYIGAIGRIRGLAVLALPGRKWAERSGDCPLAEFACMYAMFRRGCALLHGMV